MTSRAVRRQNLVMSDPAPTIFTFYMERQRGPTAVTWKGEGTQSKSDFPEKGIGVMHCVLNFVKSDARTTLRLWKRPNN